MRAYNVDEYRHSIERMDPAHYLSASYYERVLTGLATLLVEKGVVTPEELERRAGGAFPLPVAERPTVEPQPRARSAVGMAVSVRDMHPAGHTRVLRYVRGKRGIVLHVAPKFVFPDGAAHGLPPRSEHTYHVAFDARCGPRRTTRIRWSSISGTGRCRLSRATAGGWHCACAELGYAGSQGEYIVVVADTPELHNRIVCTQCSCTAWPLLGLPPDWYKSLEYRARVIREPRRVFEDLVSCHLE